METATARELTQDIRCNFCHSPSSVFSRDDGSHECIQCHAQYFPLLLPGVEADKMVIQNWAIAHEDTKSMGCMIVYGQQGDVSEVTADEILRIDEELSEGFTKLSPDFSEALWYGSDGTARIDEETIRDICRKFAFAYTGSSEDSILTVARPADENTIRVSFGRKIANRVDMDRLEKNHKMISSIPKENDNLIRYFIAEGQEKLLVIAAKKAYDSFMGRKHPCLLGAELCKAICV